MLEITELRTEYQIDPLVIDAVRPRFGWKFASEAKGTLQESYRVYVSRDESFADLVWDTGRVCSGSSIQLEYAGLALKPLTRYHARVKAWDNHGNESGWKTGTFETGYLGVKEWNAGWISGGSPADSPERSRPMVFRRDFLAEKPVTKARAYVTALGVYELSVNGKPADDSRMNPGWTSYNKWLQYQVYDLDGKIFPGENRVEILLGEGWYSGELSWTRVRTSYGDENALLFELHVGYADGTEEIISSDGKFAVSPSPVLLSDLYDGEIYDARLEAEESREWRAAAVTGRHPGRLAAQVCPAVRLVEEIEPKAMFTTPAGETVIDMGQNMVGCVRFRVKGEAGGRVWLKHCEVLDKDGNFYPGNIRSAKQEVVYTLKGGDWEEFRPHFTYQGFRYVKVIEFPGKPELSYFTGEVLHSALEPAGDFSCSNPLVNRLYHNIVWGQKGNFVDVPTDCPQRDERLGWTGDAQVFLPAACFNMDCSLFFTKWLRDLREDQMPNGAIPYVIPNVPGLNFGEPDEDGSRHSSAAWGDAAAVAPWVMYRRYGDRRVLEDNFDSMMKWLDYLRRISDETGVCRGGAQLGDWLALDAFEGSYSGATPKEYIATAFTAHSAGLTEKAARVLGETEAAEKCLALREKAKAALLREFFKDGRPVFDTQTGYVLPLMFGLTEDAVKAACVQGLADNLERNGGHLTTGFVGTPYLCDVLADNGRADLAYELLLREDFPSWLYQVKKGATTIWEHWDGIKEDGSFWSDDMNSFNHYAYGSIGDWLFRAVAGVDAAEDGPGFKRIVFKPLVTERLTRAEARYESVHGKIGIRWEREGGELKVALEIPVSTTAELCLPAGYESAGENGALAGKDAPAGKNGGLAGEDAPARECRKAGEELRMELGSGLYELSFKKIG